MDFKLALISLVSWLASYLPTVETLQYIALVVSIVAGLASLVKSFLKK